MPYQIQFCQIQNHVLTGFLQSDFLLNNPSLFLITQIPRLHPSSNNSLHNHITIVIHFQILTHNFWIIVCICIWPLKFFFDGISDIDNPAFTDNILRLFIQKFLLANRFHILNIHIIKVAYTYHLP